MTAPTDGSATPDGKLGRTVSRVRASATVLVTLLVVFSEFLLLHATYRHGLPTREAQVVAARLSGELSSASPAAAGRLYQDSGTATGELARLGVSAAELGPIRAAASGLRANPNTATLNQFRTATDMLVGSLQTRAADAGQQVDIFYVVLLIGVSLGWMVWFRRLVARHRKLQQSVTEHQLTARSEQRLAALVRNAADLVIVCDLEGTVSFVTPSARAVLGREPEGIIESNCLSLIEVEDRQRFTAALATLRPDEDRDVQVHMRHADGRILAVEGTATNLLQDPAVAGLVITIRDVTARVELESQLRHQAFHDPLTTLANRQLFSDRLAHALQRGSSEGSLVVLFCDLDEFKNINDSLGHRVGDLILGEVGQRALHVTRASDTVARLGGDEFAILLEDTDLETAMGVAEQLQNTLHDPIEVEDHVMMVRASIGLALGSHGELSGEELLRNADVAMYLAKERGKGTIAVYDSELHSQQLERLDLRAELQHAIRHDELVVYYQPIIDLSTRQIAGFESLVRWAHPIRGLVGPLEFIPIAEQTGLIHALGSIVLRAACRAAVAFSAHAGRALSISVNVTAQQLGRPDFVDEVLAVLRVSELPGTQLTLEITESLLLQDVDEVITRLAELRSHGIRIAIDDFGTGYSSLAYLRDLPLDILKVDKAFVDHVADDPNDAALTDAIIAMSHSMQLATVAEGVESEEQAQWLAGTRCGYGQGFLWSRAVSLDDALALVAPSEGIDAGWAARFRPTVLSEVPRKVIA